MTKADKKSWKRVVWIRKVIWFLSLNPRQGLDWIVRPDYSFGVFSTSRFAPAVLSSVKLTVRIKHYRQTGAAYQKLVARLNVTNRQTDKETDATLQKLVVRMKHYKQTDVTLSRSQLWSKNVTSPTRGHSWPHLVQKRDVINTGPQLTFQMFRWFEQMNRKQLNLKGLFPKNFPLGAHIYPALFFSRETKVSVGAGRCTLWTLRVRKVLSNSQQ